MSMRALAACPVWMYCPADSRAALESALETRVNAVILDLEDTVLPERKALARDTLPDLLALVESRAAAARPAVHVRVNPCGTPDFVQDIDAVSSLQGVSAVRLPKARSAADVQAVVSSLRRRIDEIGVYPLIEDATGLVAMHEIAGSHPWVRGLCLGEADLRRALRLEGEQEFAHVRSELVVASSAARLDPPMMAAYVDVGDLAGLAESCRAGRAMGFRGRTALTPEQVPVIEQAFAPTSVDISHAEEILSAWRVMQTQGLGSGTTSTGLFVDKPIVETAVQVMRESGRG